MTDIYQQITRLTPERLSRELRVCESFGGIQSPEQRRWERALRHEKLRRRHQKPPGDSSLRELARHVLTYESDTFSASAEGIDQKRAMFIAKVLRRIGRGRIDDVDGVAVHEVHWEQV